MWGGSTAWQGCHHQRIWCSLLLPSPCSLEQVTGGKRAVCHLFHSQVVPRWFLCTPGSCDTPLPFQAAPAPSWRLSLCAQCWAANTSCFQVCPSFQCHVVSVRPRCLLPARDKGASLHRANSGVCSHITQRWHSLNWLKGNVQPVTSAGDIRMG